MTRVPENFVGNTLLTEMLRNKRNVAKFSQELASGYKVINPGDSNYSATIAQMRGVLEEVAGQKGRVSTAMGYLERQDAVYSELNDILIRANEIATQAANETNSPTARAQLAEEVWEIRNQIVSLGNSSYLGRFIFAGGADNNPAFDTGYAGTQFTTPASGAASQVFAYSTNPDSGTSRSVPITNDLSVQINQVGSDVFNNALRGLTELGRALTGHRTVWTSTDPPVPDNAASTAFTFPDDFTQQTAAIQSALDAIEQARSEDVIPARTNVAGRMRRLQSASSLLELSATSATEVLTKLQQSDAVESATRLTEAQTALNASLSVTTQLLGRSILDFL